MNGNGTLRIDLDSAAAEVTLLLENGPASLWQQLRMRLMSRCPSASEPRPQALRIAWWEFSRVCLDLRSLLILCSGGAPPEVQANAALREAVTTLRRDTDLLLTAAQAAPISEAELLSALDSVGFRRRLQPYQIRNVCRLAALRHGATFSVPGAGKTTEALALFAYRGRLLENLVVACPKNAFAAWEEQIAECLPQLSAVRLVGGADRIGELLQGNPRVALVGYQQLVTATAPVAQHLARSPGALVLDESHKIKRGESGVWGTTVLNLSHLPRWKLVMSGTPMPNSEDDLVPQIRFLIPGFNPEAQTRLLREVIRPLYVRTRKDELNLPPISAVPVTVRMTQPQRLLYQLCAREAVRLLVPALRSRDRNLLRRVGRCHQLLLQLASNPALLLGGNHGLPDALLHAAVDAGTPKVDWVCQRARELAAQGQKTLIWTNFVSNVETIAARLADLNAQAVYGQVPTGDEDDNETREGRIRLFKTNPECFVLVANPQACAEAISLHRECHHSVYVDRTYNAAQFLQSQDRIHRIGLAPGQITTMEILACPGTIDISVENRLSAKIRTMREVLNDDSIGFNVYWAETEDEDFDLEDAADLLRLLQTE